MDESPPVADLRLHTTTSDDRLTIGAFPDIARTDGMNVVAMTGHDRYHPELGAPMIERNGVTVVRGIELHVDAGDRRISLLGYGLGGRPAPVKTVERLQWNRIERAREIVAAVKGETGVRLEIDIHDDVDRLHAACTIGTGEAPYDYQGMFDELIGADSPCYVARELPTFDNGATALRDAYDVVGLAYPFRYRGPAGAFELYADLNTVERYYPYGFDVRADLVEKAVKRYSLLATSGSGAHNETFGRIGPPETNFTQFAAAVDGL